MTVGTGTTLAGRFRLDERIATGGMGEVWRARDVVLERDVAVKVLKHEYASDPAFLERFRAEARSMASLDHPNVARMYDYGEDADAPYLVMELVAGEPLSHLLAREGRLDVDRTLDLVGQVALALHAAHQAGVVHRDVKPGNILVTPTGTVKVTDFGIARATSAAALTQTGVVLGTAHYLSPEQASGRPVTPASDVYSLGVVTYECLAGARPYGGDTPTAIAAAHLYDEFPDLPADVPEPVAALVRQAMAKDPEGRFRSAAAFARAASAASGGGDGLAGPARTMALPVVDTASTAVRPGPERRRRRTPVLAALLLPLLLLAALAAWGLSRPSSVDPPAGRPSPAQVTTRAPQPRGVPDGLIGQPYDEVAATLRSLGLRPVREWRYSKEEPGTVIEIEPTTGLLPGQPVTVTVSAGERDQDDDKDEGGKGRGKKDDD